VSSAWLSEETMLGVSLAYANFETIRRQF